MKITFTLSNLTDRFYEDMAPLAPAERLAYLFKKAQKGSGLDHCVKAKIGTGQFRDAVEFNAMQRGPLAVDMSEPLPRRGYKLIQAEVQPA